MLTGILQKVSRIYLLLRLGSLCLRPDNKWEFRGKNKWKMILQSERWKWNRLSNWMEWKILFWMLLIYNGIDRDWIRYSITKKKNKKKKKKKNKRKNKTKVKNRRNNWELHKRKQAEDPEKTINDDRKY